MSTRVCWQLDVDKFKDVTELRKVELYVNIEWLSNYQREWIQYYGVHVIYCMAKRTHWFSFISCDIMPCRFYIQTPNPPPEYFILVPRKLIWNVISTTHIVTTCVNIALVLWMSCSYRNNKEKECININLWFWITCGIQSDLLLRILN